MRLSFAQPLSHIAPAGWEHKVPQAAKIYIKLKRVESCIEEAEWLGHIPDHFGAPCSGHTTSLAFPTLTAKQGREIHSFQEALPL